MWRERALGLDQRLDETLSSVADIDDDQPLLRRVRRLLYLRRMDQEVLVRIMARRPSLLGWAVRQQDEVRALLDAEESEEAEEESEEE